MSTLCVSCSCLVCVCVFNPCVGLTRETCGKAEKRTVLIRSRRDSLAGPHNKNWEESLENEDLHALMMRWPFKAVKTVLGTNLRLIMAPHLNILEVVHKLQIITFEGPCNTIIIL